MVGAPSFSQPIQPPLESSTKILSFTLVNSHVTFSPVLFNKIILKIYTKTPFLYTAAFFYFPIFSYNHLSNVHQKRFPYLSHLANSGCAKGQKSYGVL